MNRAELPLAVRRLGELMTGPASVARFWGEFAQPRIEGAQAVPEIDPDLALGTMPACTAGLHTDSAGRGRVPRIDPDLCTACGKCWVSCPDTAIGAVALGPQALLDAASELAPPPASDEIGPVASRLKRHVAGIIFHDFPDSTLKGWIHNNKMMKLASDEVFHNGTPSTHPRAKDRASLP